MMNRLARTKWRRSRRESKDGSTLLVKNQKYKGQGSVVGLSDPAARIPDLVVFILYFAGLTLRIMREAKVGKRLRRRRR